MLLSDVSVKRPVLAAVMSIVLLVFGLVAFDRLPLRQYPDIDPPVVSISTNYPGAAANVVETRITKVIEDRIAGVAGIKFMSSSSQPGRSSITIEFAVTQDIDSATNDIRDRVSSILNDIPEEADPPEVRKVDSNEDVIMWLNLTGENMTVPELTDYADRYLADRFSVIDGVARVRIGGQQRYAMRIWLDRQAMAARALTVSDVEQALRSENVELPAGSLESRDMQFTVRTERAFRSADDFANLVLSQAEDVNLIRLGDIARVEWGTEENRTFFRGNGIPQVGIGVIKQSTANTIEVARAAKEAARYINKNLPEGMVLEQSYDTSVFIEGAINEVYRTLLIAILLVVFVIYLFLGSARAMLVPAITVPVSIIATFIALYVLGFSINLLTLLALVLAIGLVVDDAIVVLENISRRINEKNESPLLAAFLGTRQVAFAVLATTAVLIAVFVPIAFLQGDVGRLFSEFALTMACAVIFSSFVALSLSAALASKLLHKDNQPKRLSLMLDQALNALQNRYLTSLHFCVQRPISIVFVFFFLLLGTAYLFKHLPQEYAPREDRGAFFIIVNGPEGATYQYMEAYMNEIERRLMPYTQSGEFTRLLVRAPRAFGRTESYNGGIVIIVLDSWGQRRNGFELMSEVRGKLADLPGVRAFPVMRQGFGGGIQKPVQFVIGGGTYAELAQWRDILLAELDKNNPGLLGVDWDYKETTPHLKIVIDYDQAAELGITQSNIGRTLETMLGSRRVTTFVETGEEYDVIVEGERDKQRTITNLENIYVRSDTSGQLVPLSNMVTIKEYADSNALNRYNRVRALTLSANLSDGYTLGEALDYLNSLVDRTLPDTAIVDYKGESQDYMFAGDSILFIFILGLLITYLVLAAQFENWIHPAVIMLSVPLAMVGGLLGLKLMGGSLNLYSQIGLIMLVGLAAKNGILIVEFANQLRGQGHDFFESIEQAARVRLRPILMTGITTAAGAIPLILASGAGAETRTVIGVVVFSGILSATAFTLFVVPVAYTLFAKGTKPPGARERQLELERHRDKN